MRVGDPVVLTHHDDKLSGQVGEVVTFYRSLPATVEVRFGRVIYGFFADELRLCKPNLEEVAGEG